MITAYTRVIKEKYDEEGFKLALVEPAPYGQGPEAVIRLTQEILDIYEGWVREYPLQWRWIHWRWKNQPGGVVETYSSRDLKDCFGGQVKTPYFWKTLWSRNRAAPPGLRS